MAHSLREKTIDIITLIDNIKLDEIEIKDLEIGIFNWVIDFCNKYNIIKNWSNSKFR